MPRNSSGVYSLPAGNPVVSGTVITSTWANTTLPDIGSELTNSLDRSGRGGMLAALKGIDGTLGAPAYSFTSEPTSGLYRSGSGVLTVSIGGASVGTFSSAGWTGAVVPSTIQAALGAVGTPSYTFQGDLNTGMWSPGADIIAWSTGGAEKGRLGATGLEMPLGAVGTPSYSFAGDLNTGMWSPAADTLAWSVNGAEGFRLNTTGLGVGTTSPQAKMSVVTSNPGGVGGSWSSAWANFGPNAGSSTGAAVGISYDSTGDRGVINCVAPTVAWKKLALAANALDIYVNNAGTLGLALDNSANISFGGTSFAWSGLANFNLSSNIGTGNPGINFDSTDYIDYNRSTNLMRFSAGGVLGLNITGDGRVYGAALHNNAGSVTGTTNQYIASGTYTPTLTNGSNVTASTAYACQWLRVGNVVTVSGKVDIDPNLTSTSTQLGISLPIASTTAAAQNLAGTAVGDNGSALANAAQIFADTTNNRANLAFWSSSTANAAWSFTFTYVVL